MTYKKSEGVIYIVSTPIGNMKDITVRALEILKTADLIAAEDTRHTSRLLACYDIKTPLISFHEHNERQRTPQLIEKLSQGMSIAVVSNAGTPSVSDPGYRLVSEAVLCGINVIPVPGVSAAVTALSVSGLPTDAFFFVGFLPKKSGKRLKRLESLADETATLIFYESPRRILILMQEILNVIGNRYIVIAREMTKIHEEFIRGTLSELIDEMKSRQSIKGEITLLVSGFEKPSKRDELTHSIPSI